jgi:hypothetical protein
VHDGIVVAHAVTAQLIHDERCADRQVGPAEVERSITAEQQREDLALLEPQ